MDKHVQRKEGWKIAFIIFLIGFLLFLGYVLLGYQLTKGIIIEDIPLYIFNKAFALTSALLIGISFFLGPLARLWPKRFISKLYLRKYIGVFGFGVAALHSLISLLLFSPSYYPRFFTTAGKLTLEGQSSMLFGILALFIFAIVSITSLPSVEERLHPKQWKFIQRLGYIAYILTLLHVAVMSYGYWLTPAKWSAGLLPVSLIISMIIIIVFIARILIMLKKK